VPRRYTALAVILGVGVVFAAIVFIAHRRSESWPLAAGTRQYDVPAAVVSCPTNTFCATAHARKVVIWNGRAITVHQFSLPSLHFGVNDPLSRDIPQMNSDFIQSVSCASPHFCVAVTFGGYAIEFGPGHWGPAIRLTSGKLEGLTAVSCPSSVFCLAGSSTGESYVFNGTSWQSGGSPDPAAAGPNGFSEITAISCPQTEQCLVASALTDPMSGDYNGRVYGFSEGSWSSGSSPVNYAITALACSDSYDCVAGTADGKYLTMASGSWSDPFPVSMTNGQQNIVRIVGASCVKNAGQCFLLDQNGEFYPVTDLSLTLHGTRAFTGLGSGLTSELSCSPGGTCFVGDGSSLYEAKP